MRESIKGIVSNSRIIGIALLLLCMHPLFSQMSNKNLYRFELDTWLSQTHTRKIFQDEKGFIWFGTDNGLYRFDGYQLKHFQYNHLDKNSISNDVVNAIVQDTSGILWIGTHSGLNSYDPTTEKIKRYFNSEPYEHSAINSPIQSLMMDSCGFLWVSTSVGLSIVDPYKGIEVYSVANPIDPSDANGIQIYITCQLNDSTFWLHSTGGLIEANISGSDYSKLKCSFVKSNQSNKVLYPSHFTIDKEGRAWLLCEKNKLFVLDIHTKDIREVLFNDDRYNGHVNFLATDRSNNVWFVIMNEGFIKLNSEKLFHSGYTSRPLMIDNEYESFGTHPSLHIKEATYRTQNTFVDKSGILWIGTHNGLFYIDTAPKPFKGYYGFSKNTLSVQDDITTIMPYSEHVVLLGNPYKQLFKFNTQTCETEQIPIPVPGDNTLLISGLYKDAYDYTWVGITGGGVAKLNPETKFVKRYSRMSPDSIKLNGWVVWCLLEDKNENLWVGTGNGIERFKLGPEIHGNREFISKKIYNGEPNENGIPQKWNIWSLFEDDSGRIWAGQNMGGLGLYLPEHDNFKMFSIDKSNPHALQSKTINSIIQDSRGIIWLATDYGIAAMRCNDKDEAEFRTFTENDGLCNNGVIGILEDDRGNLWISTKNGLSRFSPPETIFERTEVGDFVNYSTSDGLLSNKFNNFAYAKNKKGELFFGGSKGVISFIPDSISMSHFLPEVVLTGLRISNNLLHVGDSLHHNFVFEKSITYSENITLSHKDNELTFEFSGLDFTSPKNFNYAWILEGFDQKWHYFGSDHRYATYTNLPSGDFVFKVKTISPDLKTSGTETIVGVKILTPYWQTWWFRLLLFLTFTGLIFAYFRFKTYQLHRQSAILKKQVKERTSELENANSQLESKNEEIVSQNEHIAKQSKKLEKQNKNLRLLDEIGQNITASIKVKDIVIKVYDIINEIMDAPEFHIGIVDYKQNSLRFWGYSATSSSLNSEIIVLDNNNRLSVNCIKTGDTVLMNDIQNEIIAFQATDSVHYLGSDKPKSAIYIPLLSTDNSVSGILVAKSYKMKAYSEMHFDILKNMANYIQIALVNAKTFNVIEEKSEQLAQMDKIKTRFFTNISHEFRTPLTMILTPIRNMLYSRNNLNCETITELGMVERNADRLLRLINQLLDISKIEGETLKLKVAENNLSQNIYRVIEPFYLHADYKNIELSVNPALEEQNCFFDADKIEKILYNLLSNAIKYTPEKGSIILSYEFLLKDSHADFVKLSVSDTGIGIPEDALNTIFDRFSRIENPNLDYIPGTGVGLSLTKKLVELHKGNISVQSSKKGSCFTVSLPVSRNYYNQAEIIDVSVLQETPYQKEIHASQIANNLTLKRKPIDRKLKTLLIIEDNPDISYYLGNYFSDKYNVLFAINGKEGLDKALLMNPDLAISDIMMPEMNGIEFCRQIKTKEETSHIPIILMTAKAEEKIQMSGYETGADDYITKPFDIEILEKRVENLISMREKLRNKYYSSVMPDQKEFSPTRTDEIFLTKILESIENNISNSDFNIDALIKEIGMSRAQLFRKMKSLTNNQSVSDFIIAYRLQRAKKMFSTGHSNVSEVAYDVGFKNPSHFTTRFKKQYGISPTEFIKKNL